MNSPNHLQTKARGAIQRSFMPTTSKQVNFSANLLILLGAIITPTTDANEIILAPTQGPRVAIKVVNEHVIVNDKERKINYAVDSAISRYLSRAEDIRLIANDTTPNTNLFIMLAREHSKPGAMGQGYCGAGYEDYILLVEVLERKLILRDQHLIQSCLNSTSMFIDQGNDKPSNGFTHEKDGSLSYRLVDDDYNNKRVIAISAKRFNIFLVFSTKN